MVEIITNLIFLGLAIAAVWFVVDVLAEALSNR
jgi:hypothetical protein